MDAEVIDFDALAVLAPGEYLITKRPDGSIHADMLGSHVVVEPDAKCRIFHRNAITMKPGIGQQRVRWLVVEHGNTRVYINDQLVLVTSRDVYP